MNSSSLIIFQVDGSRAGVVVTVSLPGVIQVSDVLLERALDAPAAHPFFLSSCKG